MFDSRQLLKIDAIVSVVLSKVADQNVNLQTLLEAHGLKLRYLNRNLILRRFPWCIALFCGVVWLFYSTLRIGQHIVHSYLSLFDAILTLGKLLCPLCKAIAILQTFCCCRTFSLISAKLCWRLVLSTISPARILRIHHIFQIDLGVGWEEHASASVAKSLSHAWCSKQMSSTSRWHLI